MDSCWMLGSDVVFLNHGSFGARPKAVFDHHSSLLLRFEQQPVQTIVAEMEQLLPSIRDSLSSFLKVSSDRIDLVCNASEAVNSILRSIDLEPGDELVVPDHAYGAVLKTLQYVADRTGAVVKIVHVPLPLESSDQIVEVIRSAISDRTRLLLIDHISSPTAVVFPIDELVSLARERGIDVLVDGAHGPGMIDLDLESLGATWYIGNLHKWVCVPIGAGFIVTDPSHLDSLHPAIISHGYQDGHVEEFNWQGTRDYSPWRSIPFVLDWIERTWGWRQMREHNHRLAVWAHRMLCQAWDVEPLTPLDGSLMGSMATLELPGRIRDSHDSEQSLHDLLLSSHRIEVPIMEWGGRLWIRFSAQIYNRPEHYFRLRDIVLSMA